MQYSTVTMPSIATEGCTSTIPPTLCLAPVPFARKTRPDSRSNFVEIRNPELWVMLANAIKPKRKVYKK